MDENNDGKIAPLQYYQWCAKLSINHLNNLLKIEQKTIKQRDEDDEDDNKYNLCPIDISYEYNTTEIIYNILNDKNRKNWSLYLLDWNNNTYFNKQMSFKQFAAQNLIKQNINFIFDKFNEILKK
eukprot:151519_1